jgi:ribonuclease III
MRTDDRHLLESRLNYRFRRPILLEEALRHSSFVNEHPAQGLRDNERFEFLGDAVLNLVVSDALMQRHPEMSEGDLSRTRALLVNESNLAELARGIDLGAHLSLGRGEIQTHGREKNSILADAFEALVAAVYLDGGFDTVYRMLTVQFAYIFDEFGTPGTETDFKTRLQELAQNRRQRIPLYNVVAEIGPDHDKTFHVELAMEGFTTRGTGKSKKLAEQDAARLALQRLADGS